MIQDILIGSGIIAAIVLSFFFMGYAPRPSDERTALDRLEDTPPRPDLPDTRPNRPEGDEEV